MSKRDDIVLIGKQAEELLENPLLREAFQGVEAAIIEKLAKIDVTDEAHTLALVRALQANRMQQNFLRIQIAGGRLAEDSLERKALLREPVKDPRMAFWRR